MKKASKPTNAVVNAWNEWDPLQRVIVGHCEGTCIPAPEPAWEYECPNGGFPLGSYGEMPRDLTDAANEQMDNFAKVLESRGIIVDRAIPIDFNQVSSTPDWEIPCMHGCMSPRDVLMTIGNEILECTMSHRSRWYEYLCYRPILEQYFKDDPKFQWASAPKPRLTDASFVKDFYHNYLLTFTEEERNEHWRKHEYQLTEKEPLFDAADGCRFGKDIFWHASAVTNKAGFNWLKRHLAERGIRIHPVQFDPAGRDYLPWHIDIYLLPIRPGLLIYNPVYTPQTEKFLELCKLNDWELIPAAKPTREYNVKVGLTGERSGPQWISMNTFSLDQNTICVEAGESRFIEQLDKLGVEVIPIEFDQVFGFGGGLHCATLDVYREGKCENYFPKQVKDY